MFYALIEHIKVESFQLPFKRGDVDNWCTIRRMKWVTDCDSGW